MYIFSKFFLNIFTGFVTIFFVPSVIVANATAPKFRIMKTIIILVIYVVMLLARHLVDVHGEEEKVFHITDKIMSCSSFLSLLINKFCDNVYKIVKRDTSVFIDKLSSRSMQEHGRKQRVLAEEHWRRVRRQVASECCERPCTIGEMIKYCPEDARLLRERPDIFD